ncbi:MAG: DUF2231 domain-containing protein [Calditrichaeota bacterium]|nr:MAG: DUF2231 domain-containing protein [Calditrichota bacterium]
MYQLHPVIVHLVIAVLSIAITVDFLYLFTKKQRFWKLASILLLIGTGMSIIAVLSGQSAYDLAIIPEGVKSLVRHHRSSGKMTMWLFLVVITIRFLFHYLEWFSNRVKWFYYLLLAVALFYLFRTGIMGGEMVYIHGVGVKKAQPTYTKPSFE